MYSAFVSIQQHRIMEPASARRVTEIPAIADRALQTSQRAHSRHEPPGYGQRSRAMGALAINFGYWMQSNHACVSARSACLAIFGTTDPAFRSRQYSTTAERAAGGTAMMASLIITM